MAKIRWSHEAEQWLREIYEYIAQDNLSAAKKVVSGIYEKAQILTDFPEIGYKYRDEPEGEIRILLYGHYRIAYIITDEYIDILGVFHGAMGIERYLP
ncbi:type II toxin-antitoxin system RelE/ParE family toxin [Desulfogranum marinum]|uniref:type II toxin-antitoxin system RelE/ParE family toxin n=1 Tax=Desulfogranum marinum TaxID=453220 RepID=UPI0029C6248D|nr:type II toxin-antitoxin system RelE/ParE family toxin [Desulfogranum marinum]